MTDEEMVYYLKHADVTVGQKCKTKTAEAIERVLEIIEQQNFEGMTNGDVIQVLYKPYKTCIYQYSVHVYMTEEDFMRAEYKMNFETDWWDSPYKEVN